MPQGGAASRHTPRRSPESPSRDNNASPFQHYHYQGPDAGRHDMANFSDNPSSKTNLGVQNILNHSSGAQPPLPPSSSQQQQQSSPSIGGPASRLSLPDTDLSPGGSQVGVHYGHQPHATARQFPFPGPSGSMPSSVGERPSPTSAYQLPSLTAARRILSPRLSRPSSVGQRSPHGAEPPHPFIHSPTAQKRPFGDSVGDVEGPPPPFVGPQPRSIMPPLGSSSQRSLSQPSLMPPRLLTQDQQPPLLNPPSRPPSGQGDIQQRPIPTTAFPTQLPFPGAAPPMSTQPYPGPGHLVDSRPWGPESVSAGGGSLRHMAQSHPAHEADGFLYVGPGGERIHVPIDRQKASLEANVKRERNAGASARFRQRKKERDRELMERAQLLEDDKRRLTQQLQDLSHQVQELTEHVEFYKNERNRLRDVVANTPTIRDQAAGPPSPVLSLRRAESYADRSPTGQHHMAQSTSQGYASSDASSVERPARRRRTDANPPDYSPVSYASAPAYPQGPSPSSGLPPLHIGPLQPPSPSSMTGPERLPPFRPLVSPGGMPQDSQSPTPVSQPYPSITRATPELGWATRPTAPP